MVSFTTTLEKFGQQGEKTGWTYIIVPAATAEEIKAGTRKTFRVKGCLDKQLIAQRALLPRGNGDYILPVNASLRKALRKKEGDQISVNLEEDNQELALPKELLDCLADDPPALEFFNSLAKSHQQYFGKWIDEAKTDATRTKRIAQSVIGLGQRKNFGALLRGLKAAKENF